MSVYRVCFIDENREGIASGEESLLDISRRLGVAITASCGGRGRCGRCRIRIVSGRVSPPTAIEQQRLSAAEINKGYRLACQTYVSGDVVCARALSDSQAARGAATEEKKHAAVLPAERQRSFRRRGHEGRREGHWRGRSWIWHLLYRALKAVGAHHKRRRTHRGRCSHRQHGRA